MRALKVQVTGRDGKAVHWWEQIVLARGGEADVVLPIAYNDHPGACSVTDILAPGARATAELRVMPGD